MSFKSSALANNMAANKLEKQSASNSCNTTLLSSSNSSVVFTIHVDGMYVNENTVGAETHQKLSIPGDDLITGEGLPQLPVISKLIAIPDCDNVSITITPSGEANFYNYNVIPAPAYIYEKLSAGDYTQSEIIKENKTIYLSNSFFPGKFGEIVETGYVRGQKIARIELYPVQFNSAKSIINAYSDFTVTLTFINPKSQVNKEVGIFRNIINTAAINYNLSGLSAESRNINILQKSRESKSVLSSNTSGSVTRINNTGELIGANAKPVDYLIITHSSLFNSGSLTKLAEYRESNNGFDVAIIQVDNTIYDSYPGRPHYQSIRDFISDVFLKGKANHTGDGHLGYIVLVGDAYTDPPDQKEMVPSAYPSYYSAYEQGGDYYYACTGGDNDDLQDLIYGRISAGNEDKLSNVVNKTIAYESEPKANWQRNVSFISFSPWFFDDDDNCDSYFYQMAGIIPKSNYISYAWRGFSKDTASAWGKSYFENHPDNQSSLLNVPENINEIFSQRFTGWRWYNFITGLNTYQVMEGGEYTDSLNNCGAAELDNWLYNKLNEGQRFFIYEGHSGPGCLGANEGSGRRIFRVDQLDSKLHNYGMYPFIIANGCETGEFDIETTDDMGSVDCLAEKTVNMKDAGAIGFLGSTRESTPSAFNHVDRYVLDAFYNNSAHIMGEAVMQSKLLLNITLRRQYNLYGDPATNLLNTNTFTSVNNNNSTYLKYELGNNYPNPFNPTTTIKYQIKTAGFVKLKIYDVLGREIKTLVNENKNEGSYSIQFNGNGYASGIYYYQLSVKKSGSSSVSNDIFISTKKMIMLK